jgi:hypothetical protein
MDSIKEINTSLLYNINQNIIVNLSDTSNIRYKNIGDFHKCSDTQIKSSKKHLYNEFLKTFAENSSSFCFLKNDKEIELGGNPIQTNENTDINFVLIIDFCSIEELGSYCYEQHCSE